MAPSYDEWLAVKQTLFDAWHGGKPLNSDFIRWMKEEHAFIASKGQYERKFKEWGWRKNLTEDEMQYVLFQFETRKRIGKKSEVTLAIGDFNVVKVVIPQERIRKRKYREGYDPAAGGSTVTPCPGISVHTPPSFQDELSGTDCILYNSFAARGRSRKRIYTQDFISQHRLVVNCDSLPSFELLRIVESPHLRDMFLKSLQSAKEDPELSVSENLGPEEIAREMRLRFIFKKAELFPRMRRTVYFFVLNTFCSGLYPTLSYQGGLTMSVRSTIHQMLSSDVLERHEGDLQRRLDRLLGPTSTPDAFFEALAIAIQLGSNGRWESERDILVWLAAQKMSLLEALFDLKLPSIQVFLENLVHCTLDFHRHDYTLKNRSINTPRMQPVYRAARTLLTADRQHHIFAENKTRRITTALELDHIDMVAILLKEGVDTNASIIIEGRPVTLLAIANSIETSRLLVEAGADLNATFPAWRGSANWTALSCATDVPGCSKLVRYLLSVGACPPLATQNLEAPSLTDTYAKESRSKFQELYTGDSEAFWLLRQADLKVGFRVNLRPDDISLSDEDHVRNCIACDDENVKQGFPAFEGWHEMLLYSIEKNLPKLIDLFLKTRFNVNAEIRSFYGQSLIEVAHTLGRPELVSQLMLHGAREVIQEPIQDSIEDPTVLSVKKAVEDGELLQNILEGSMKLEELLRDNLFHHEGLWSVLEELVRLVLHDLPWEIITKVSPQCQQFVLITAIEYDEMESAAKLVQEGVELKLLEGNQAGHFPEQQCTILQLVCFKASLGWACGQLVQTMLHYGALQHEPETDCYKGYEALRLSVDYESHDSSIESQLEVAQILLEAGATPIAPPSLSSDRKIHIPSTVYTLLHTCGDKYITDVVMLQSVYYVLKTMLSKGSGINTVTHEWERYIAETAFHIAIRVGDWNKFPDTWLEIVSLLMESGANINAPRADGWTALQAAVINFNPNEKLISFLLQKGADVNAPAGKSEGITALQGAAIEGQITIVKRLLELGADPNAPGAEEEGRTALEGAAETGRLDTVVLLLNNGAIPTMEAVWYAEREGHFVIGDIIRKQLPECQRTVVLSQDFHERMARTV